MIFPLHIVCIIQFRITVKTISVLGLATELRQPNFPILLRRFLYDQFYPDSIQTPSEVPLRDCPSYTGKVHLHSSAAATFHAPSDPSGIGGMRREIIRATPLWRKSFPRFDCVFLSRDPGHPAMQGMDVVRVICFFSFTFHGIHYPCAFVHWFTTISDGPDEDTGMWVVQPEMDPNSLPVVSVIHLDCVIRAAHLIGIFGGDFIPKGLHFSQSLDSFKKFYINRFIDHHAFMLLEM
jgi:hypothetical protein